MSDNRLGRSLGFFSKGTYNKTKKDNTEHKGIETRTHESLYYSDFWDNREEWTSKEYLQSRVLTMGDIEKLTLDDRLLYFGTKKKLGLYKKNCVEIQHRLKQIDDHLFSFECEMKQRDEEDKKHSLVCELDEDDKRFLTENYCDNINVSVDNRNFFHVLTLEEIEDMSLSEKFRFFDIVIKKVHHTQKLLEFRREIVTTLKEIKILEETLLEKSKK